MTLGFSTQINGKPNYFVEKIWQSFPDEFTHDNFTDYFARGSYEYNFDEDAIEFRPKLHTIREDSKDRWKAGNKIHFVINNRTPERFQFAPVLKCVSVQKIEIKYNKGGGVNVFIDEKFFHYQTAWGLEWDKETKEKMINLALNDGFDSLEDFFNYFNKDFTGKIIHWTNLKY